MNDDQRPRSSTHGNRWMARLRRALGAEPRTPDQLRKLLRETQRRGVLDSDALAMIEGVLEVSELRVRDIMIPRSQMVVVERDAMLEQIVPVVVESAHSRYPVIGESRDEVVGIMLAKDLIGYLYDGARRTFNVRDILRPVVFVPASKRLDVLLKEFRVSRNHLAVVVDEYGGVAGMVTIEDVLEQIVGDIEDEYDFDDDATIHPYSETNYTLKATTPIEEFNEFFGTSFSDEEVDTVGGLVVRGLGHLPRRGETFGVGRFRFKVLRADARRVHLLQLTVQADGQAPGPGGAPAT